MDPKSPLGLGHPTPSFTDLRDDARTIDDASRSSEMSKKEISYFFNEAWGIQDPDNIIKRNRHPYNHRA
ncbi:hypothetical protein B0T13DRAFT_507010 [Neurospora crassa]|nr:hypothetical protein B0T13DRAFT_507010 [Neurospora crassa]